MLGATSHSFYGMSCAHCLRQYYDCEQICQDVALIDRSKKYCSIAD